MTNIPSGMVTDQFGMIGLLAFIRAAETDPGMVHLALGSDLTTLGLNLNSPEYDNCFLSSFLLHFHSPFCVLASFFLWEDLYWYIFIHLVDFMVLLHGSC